MKKIIAMLIALLVLAAPMTALAHGHSSSSKTKVCTVRSCKKKSSHKHSGKTYRAHHASDGHSYHNSKHH